MKTAQTIAFDSLDERSETAGRMPEGAALIEELRGILARVTEWMTGTDPERSRADFLAQASDPADLERRMQAWERAQEMRRALPLVL